MSRAFVKEDIDVPEPSNRRRSASGLPPGALNFMTEAGAHRLRQRLTELKSTSADESEIAELESILESATIVNPPERPEEVVFGVSITLRSASGESKSYRVVGVDEVHLEPTNVSWVSAIGKALLGAKLDQRVSLEPKMPAMWRVIKID
jgi:transcription elongation GreA/GreB family factor